MPIYQIIPQDILFFRDGRPMEAGAGSGGHGANWPAPSLIFDAIHAALYRAYPNQQTWEHPHRLGKSSDRNYQREATQRFGSLATTGPFPCWEEADTRHWLFPCPADVVPSGSTTARTLHPIKDAGGANNLPKPLLYPVANPSAPSKDEPKLWWSKQAIEAYLSNHVPDSAHLWDTGDLFAGEWTTGIGIDPATGIQDGERIYSAEYLRLKANVSLGVTGTMPLKADNYSEGLNQLIPQSGAMLVLGGQQRACQVRRLDDRLLNDFLPVSPAIQGDRVKWLLLSPAIYPRIEPGEREGRKIETHPGGWLPNWISPKTGKVLLKKGDTRRGEREAREDWRQRIRGLDDFDCSLVAARIPKPLVLTGWSERKHLLQNGGENGNGPKPTLLAVPAGAVYYFEGKDAVGLSQTISWHGTERENIQRIENRRSTLMGEKGFGLGVCGPWNFYQDVP